MSPWRLEWFRFVRTPRWIVLFGVYLTFGLIGPVMAKYMADILEHAQSEMTIILPPPAPKDGIVNYLSQVGQIGLIVVVAIAASAMTFDARRGVSTFLRSRVSSIWELVRPRVAVTAMAAVLAYGLGTLAAWYETALLLGPLPVGAMLGGLLCESVYLTFAVAVVAAVAPIARSTIAVAAIALAALIVLSIVGGLGVLHDWLPSALSGAPAALLAGTSVTDYLPALLVTATACPLLITAGVIGLRHREI
jgi:ABC-2 type transport system permease protein